MIPLPKVGKAGVSSTEMPRDVAGFKHIYQLHSRNIYSFCLGMVGNRAEAENLMTEAFLNVLRQVDNCHGDANLAKVLYRSVITAMRTELHNNQSRCDAPRRSGTSSHGQSRDLPAVKRIPQSVSTSAIDPWRLKRTIVELPPDLRIVFVLHDVLGYEHGEVAEILEFSPDTSRSQLHKARLRLRGLLFVERRPPGTFDDSLRAKQGQESRDYAGGSANRGQEVQKDGKDLWLSASVCVCRHSRL